MEMDKLKNALGTNASITYSDKSTTEPLMQGLMALKQRPPTGTNQQFQSHAQQPDQQVKKSSLESNNFSQTTPAIERLPVVSARLGKCRSSIYAMLDINGKYFDPNFPKPVKLGARAIGWYSDEISEYIMILLTTRGR